MIGYSIPDIGFNIGFDIEYSDIGLYQLPISGSISGSISGIPISGSNDPDIIVNIAYDIGCPGDWAGILIALLAAWWLAFMQVTGQACLALYPEWS
jgi:hypothetical protein